MQRPLGNQSALLSLTLDSPYGGGYLYQFIEGRTEATEVT